MNADYLWFFVFNNYLRLPVKWFFLLFNRGGNLRPQDY